MLVLGKYSDYWYSTGGAPGGKSDTETAQSIIDEADLICYIVTNDSIQETGNLIF